MARRHGTKGAPKRSKARPVDRKESSMKRWNKLSDIPMDEEDQFHASRDQILLDGEDAQSDDEGEEEEVFALKGIPDDSDEDDSENEEGEGDSDEEDEIDEKPAATKAKKSKQSKAKQKADSPPLSGDDSASEEEEEGWGTKKSAYYSSNAAELDSEDEEANELEEQEAKRLQAKLRENMADEDFGLGDIAGADSDEQLGEFDEPAPSVQLQSLPQDKQGLLRHLQKTNPEALALAGDWDGTARQLIRVQEQIELIDSDPSVDMLSSGMLHLYYQSLLQYAATLAFYLYLRASDKYTQHPESLRSHPIMSRLLTLKQSMSTFESLGVGELDDDDESDLDSDEGVGEGLSLSQLRGLAPNELERLLAEVEALKSANPEWAAKGATESEAAPKKSKAKKNKAENATLGEDEPPKKKRKTEKKDKASASAVKLPVFDLEEPEFPATSKSKSKSSTSLANGDSSAADNFGEFTTLQDADAQDKAARKRSLRFHTSKIESASARREKARAALGGDDDIPWKDRQKERDKKAKQALAKTRGQGGEDLDDAEPEPRVEGAGKKRRREEEEGSGSDGEGDDAAGYYNLVQQKSKEKKEKKKAEYEAAQAALREGMYEDDTAGNGPRSVSRAILANKGLTPHRSKSVRNPRVKKRQRYEKAKKKVSSQKAVFKGGLAATGKYEGEKSGITKVIKGVRLS